MNVVNTREDLPNMFCQMGDFDETHEGETYVILSEGVAVQQIFTTDYFGGYTTSIGYKELGKYNSCQCGSSYPSSRCPENSAFCG
jgi:hypothetical protein